MTASGGARTRRGLLGLAGGAVLTGAAQGMAQGTTQGTAGTAAPWPDRPLRWVVGYPPGGASDGMARLFAAPLSAGLGQAVVVENRPGGGSVLAAELVARAAPDGHTLLHVDNGVMVANPALYARLPYDPARDLAPVGFIGRFPLAVLLRPDHPAADFAALLAASRGRALTVGTPGVASPHHLALELAIRRTALAATHVPYRGGPAAMGDLLSGQVDAAVMDFSTGLPFLRAGRARAVALFSADAAPALPGVPTLAALGFPDTVAYGWQGVAVPAATPPAVVARLNAALLRAAEGPGETRDRLDAIGVERLPLSPAAFAALIAEEAGRWQPLIRELGIRLEG